MLHAVHGIKNNGRQNVMNRSYKCAVVMYTAEENTTNKDESLSFGEAVTTMKNNYKKHWEWMDQKIASL